MPDQVLDRGDTEPPIADATRDQHRARPYDTVTIGNVEHVAGDQSVHGATQIDAGAEAGGLQTRSEGEAHTGDPSWEAKIVADHRTRTGLPANCFGLEQDGLQTLRRTVDRCCQPRRA